LQAGVISLKSPLKGIIPLKNKGENSLDLNVLKEVQQFLKSVILEIFDKKKSFVSLEYNSIEVNKCLIKKKG